MLINEMIKDSAFLLGVLDTMTEGFMLVDAEGRTLSRAGGYQTPRQFLSWLEEALGGAGAGRLRVSGP